MLCAYLSRSQEQGSVGINAEAFRPLHSRQEQDFSPQFPYPKRKAATKVVSTPMATDGRSRSLTEHRAARETRSSEDNQLGVGGDECKESRNHAETFVAVIAQAVLSVPTKRMTLNSIYNYIASNFPHFDKEKGPGWRNSVRHNLSSNNCFIKASRAENGKGHYWMIHPKDLPEFAKGNYRRPRKPRRAIRTHGLRCSSNRQTLGVPLPNFLVYPYRGNTSSNLDFSVQSYQRDAYQHRFGLPQTYDYFPLEDSASYPKNSLRGFKGLPPPPAPPPYGRFWPENSVFRNRSHLQSSTFLPYLYMS